jgi:hypothetical protein
VLVTKGDEDPTVVRQPPRLAHTQGRGAVDGPAVSVVRGARGTSRTVGRRVV